MENSKKSFILHLDSLEILEELSNEEIGIFMRSILYYQKNNSLPDNLPSLMKIAIMPFINQFKRDNQKYNIVVERNKENGKKGGRPKNNPENPVGYFGFKSEPTLNPENLDSDKDNERENDSDKEKDKDNDSSSSFFQNKSNINKYTSQNNELDSIIEPNNTNILTNNKSMTNDPIQTKEELFQSSGFKLIGEKYLSSIPDYLKRCYTDTELWHTLIEYMPNIEKLEDWCCIINHTIPEAIASLVENMSKNHYKKVGVEIKPLIFFTSSLMKEILAQMNIQEQTQKQMEFHKKENQKNAISTQEKLDNGDWNLFKDKIRNEFTDTYYKGFETTTEEIINKEMHPLFIKLFESFNFDYEVKEGALRIFYSTKCFDNFKKIWDKVNVSLKINNLEHVFKKQFKKVFGIKADLIIFEEVY